MVRVRVSNGERESNDNGDDDDIDDDLELHSRTTKSETRDEEAQLENAPKEGTLKAFSIESKPLFTLLFASPLQAQPATTKSSNHRQGLGS